MRLSDVTGQVHHHGAALLPKLKSSVDLQRQGPPQDLHCESNESAENLQRREIRSQSTWVAGYDPRSSVRTLSDKTSTAAVAVDSSQASCMAHQVSCVPGVSGRFPLYRRRCSGASYTA